MLLLTLTLLIAGCRDADNIVRLVPQVLMPSGKVSHPVDQSDPVASQPPQDLPPRQPTEGFEFVPSGTDSSGRLLFQIKILQGGNPYQVATSKLTPLFNVDGKTSATYVAEAYFNANPNRTPSTIQPGDEFTLSLPADTFIVRWQEERQEHLGQTATVDEYVSERGDRLRYYLTDPFPLRYELLRADGDGIASIQLDSELPYLLGNGRTDVVRLAKLIYRVDDPDIFQLEAVRGLAATLKSGEPTTIRIDRKQQHLDPVRDAWPRAFRIEPVPEPGRNHLSRAVFQQFANPQVLAIEDAVGDGTEIGELPAGRVFRIEYNRDGSVHVYYKTGADDTRGKRDPYLLRENERWSAIYRRLAPETDPPVKWSGGQPSDLEPFPTARDPSHQTDDPVRAYDYLVPGRTIVYTFQPIRTLSSVQAQIEFHELLREMRDRYRTQIEQGLDYLERQQRSPS
jgi:hypothetical protein